MNHPPPQSLAWLEFDNADEPKWMLIGGQAEVTLFFLSVLTRTVAIFPIIHRAHLNIA